MPELIQPLWVALAGPLLGEVLALLGELQFGAEDVEEVCRVGLVVDGEAGIDADGRAVDAEQAGPDAWNVPPQTLVGRSVRRPPLGFFATDWLRMVSTRWSMDSAARRVKVSSRIRCGGTPSAIRWAAR